jgi:DNA-binding CsgD family transcriptional regulator
MRALAWPAGRQVLASGPVDNTVNSHVPPVMPPGSLLIGRDRELDIIQGFLRETAARGGTLLLWGDPGVGKTALLDRAAEAGSETGALVLRGAGAAFETEVSFSTLHQVLLPLNEHIDRLDPAHRDVLASALGLGPVRDVERHQLADATLLLLHLVAEDRPLLVVVDDLQWVDRSSAGVLNTLTGRLARNRIGLLASARSEPGGFFDQAGLQQYQLEPLDRHAAAALLAVRFPHMSPVVTQRVLAEAQGNPLALLELPTALTDAQHAGTRSLPAVLPLSRRLSSLFASRVTDLPEATFQLLLAAALEGESASRVLRDARPADIAPARSAGLVTLDASSAGNVAFRHPLVRSAVIEVATSAQRRQAHLVLAQVLAQHPERRAWHLAESAVGPDAQVADLLDEAAHRLLRRGDALGAVAALLRAADLSPRDSDRRRRITDAAYLGAKVTGDLHAASQLLDDARRTGPELAGSLQTAVVAAYVLLSGEGDVDTAHRLLVSALDAIDTTDRTPDKAIAEALQTLLFVCLGGSRLELWAPFYAATARFAAPGSSVLDLQSRLLGDPVRTAAGALPELDAEIARLIHEADPVRVESIARAATHVDRVPACRESLWRVVRDGRAGGAVATALGAMTHLCLDDVKAGRWDDALRLADEGLALCSVHGYALAGWPLTLTQALVAAARGDFPTTRALTERMTRWAAPRGMGGVMVFAWHAQALAALGRGDFEDAYQLLTRISPAGTFASHAAQALWVPMYLVEAAVATDRLDEARSHVTAMQDAGLATLSPRLALLEAGSAAMSAPVFTPALFEAALTLPAAERWPFDLGRVRLAYGQRLRRARATGDARIQLTKALELFNDLGAEPWAARAESELLATSLTKARTGPSPSATLTPQERAIALLAASGMTNKQIADRLLLSHRTVGAHLHQIFIKLDITTRAALRDALDPDQPDRQAQNNK